MNGDRTVAGPQPANPGEPGNSGISTSDAFRLLRTAKAALEARGEWRLGREIEDALARWDAEENPPKQLLLATGEGERGGKAVHGENPQDAEIGGP